MEAGATPMLIISLTGSFYVCAPPLGIWTEAGASKAHELHKKYTEQEQEPEKCNGQVEVRLSQSLNS